MNRNKNGKGRQNGPNASRRSRNAPRSATGLSIRSSGNQSVGAANMSVLRRPTYIIREPAPFHPRFGAGQRVSGKQYLTSIITTGTDSQLFSGNSPATINQFYVSPDAFNGRLALEARTYQRYLFRKLRLIYTPRVATTQAGEFVLGYYSDAAPPFTGSFASVQDSEAAVVSSFHNGGQQLVFDIDIPQGADMSYYCELDSTTIAGFRSTIQGVIQGYPDVTSIGALTMGNLSVEYVVDFYCPASDLGFTLERIKDEDESRYLRAAQLKFRQEHQDLKVYTQVEQIELKSSAQSAPASARPSRFF